MIDKVTQSDWTHFKTIRERALERLCKGALDDLVEIASDATLSHHERYLQIFQKLQEYDRQIAKGFDYLSRSRMFQQITYARSLRLISDDEMAKFTQQIQDDVAKFTGS